MTTIGYCTYFTVMCIMAILEAKWYWTNKMTILASLLLFDVITWVYKSYALWTVGDKEYYENGKVKRNWFSSTVLKVWVMGKIITLLLPMIFISAAYLMWLQINNITTALIGLIAAAELVSIIQNFIIARTKKRIDEVDALTWVMQTTLGFVKWWIEKNLTTEPFKKK